MWDIECFNGAVEWEGDLVCAPSIPPGAASKSATTQFTRYSTNCNWTDSGKAFTARYYSEWYDGGDPTTDKTFPRLQLLSTDTAEAGGQGFALTVKTEKNWQAGVAVSTVDVTDFKVGTGYAETPYGTEPWGDPELPVKTIPLSNQKMKSMRAVLENSEPNGDFVINAMAVEMSPKYVNMKDE